MLLCVQGKKLLYDYCEQQGIRQRKTGKLMVATSAIGQGTDERLILRHQATESLGISAQTPFNEMGLRMIVYRWHLVFLAELVLRNRWPAQAVR